MSLRAKLLKFVIGMASRSARNLDYRQFRTKFEQDSVRLGKPAKGTRVEIVPFPNFHAEWVHPPHAADNGVILYLHGGSFVFGSAQTHRPLVSHLAVASELKVLVLDYRLAPEHPFPSALDDCWDGYHWLLAQGFSADQIILAGDSSGAALGLSLMMKLRDQNHALPKAGVFISTWSDLTNSGASIIQNKNRDPMVVLEKLEEWGKMYIGPKGNVRDPMISPLFGNFKELPPLFVCASSTEILFSDSEKLVEKARAANVDVEWVVGSDMLHVWPLLVNIVPESKVIIRQMANFIRKHTAAVL